jgi:hypothetical protein
MPEGHWHVSELTKNAALCSHLTLMTPPEEIYPVLDFFENVGLLTKRGYLNRQDVWDAFGYSMFNLWADMREFIDTEQKDTPATYEDFSQLMNEMREIDQQREHGASDHPSPAQVYQFYSFEAQAQPGGPVSQGHGKAQ